MSLFIVLKNTLNQFSEHDENCKILVGWELETDNVKLVFKQMQKMLIEETVSLAFPRPHNVVKYLIDYLIEKKAKKAIKSLWKIVFEQYCFNETKLYADDINKRAKISLNNIGFYAFQYLLETSIGSSIILDLLTPNFVRMWVNRMNKRSKMRLESVISLDESFKQWIKQNPIDSSKSLFILQKLFGPNSNSRFTFKSNLPLFIDISQNLSEESIKEYISYSQELFKNPNLTDFYPVGEVESSEEEDKDDKDKLKANKEDNIRIFVLNTLVNTVTIFKNHTEHSLKDVINFIVYQAFFQESLSENIKEFAKDKLFALVEGLYKRRDGKNEDGKDEELAINLQKNNPRHNKNSSNSNTNQTSIPAFLHSSTSINLPQSLENKSMWITEINKTIGRYALEGNEFNTIDHVDNDKVKGKRDNKHKLKLGN
jgi:hypothetical protein